MYVRQSAEQPTRDLIGRVIRQEFDEFEEEIRKLGDAKYADAVSLCVIAAGYVTVNAAECWPTDADVREIARHTATSARGFELREDDVYKFISRAALGGERLDQVFTSAKDIAWLPLAVASTMLLAFLPRDKDNWWEYLDTIWNATNAAERADMSILPALLIRQKHTQAAAKQ
jgi:hypothetical protein